MINSIDPSTATPAALIKLGLTPDTSPSNVVIGTIVWCKPEQRDFPLVIQLDNGAMFKCGGLSDLQLDNLPALMPDLLTTRVVVSYRHEVDGVPSDARFKTLLLKNDSRPSAQRLLNTLSTIKGAVQ